MADFSFPSHGVVRMLERAIREYGIPMKIRVDNGPEFTCSVFVNWCAQRDILIQYIQPGRPMQNAYIERFNRTFRQDVLDAYIFEDLYQFREITCKYPFFQTALKCYVRDKICCLRSDGVWF